MSKLFCLILILLLLPALASAQSGTTEFPADAKPLETQALQERLKNQVFYIRIGRAESRMEFKDNGYVFVNAANGSTDSGKWRVEGSSICSELRRAAGGCSEVRLVVGELLYLKRLSNGEVVPFTSR